MSVEPRRVGLTGNDKSNIGAAFFYGGDAAAEITGVEQQTTMPLFRENFQLGMGINAPMLDVATPCTFTPVVIVVTSIPAMYTRDGATPTTMGMLIKDLIESHPKAVTGIDFGYELGVDEQPVGHDGQTMKVPTKTKRSGTSPSFTFSELSGDLVYNCFKKWIWDIQHPDTNASMAQVQYPGAYTMSAYSMTMMAIQFDPTMRPDHIIDAACYSNMFPTSCGNIQFERTIGTVRVPERSIEFSAIVHHNPYIKSLAIALAEELQLHNHNYNIAPPNKLTVDANLMNGSMQLGLHGEQLDRASWANRPGVERGNPTGGSLTRPVVYGDDPNQNNVLFDQGTTAYANPSWLPDQRGGGR